MKLTGNTGINSWRMPLLFLNFRPIINARKSLRMKEDRCGE